VIYWTDGHLLEKQVVSKNNFAISILLRLIWFILFLGFTQVTRWNNKHGNDTGILYEFRYANNTCQKSFDCANIASIFCVIIN